jgi:hypothetical protein
MLVDPRSGQSMPIAALRSDGDTHAVTGLAFHPDGTLYASEARNSSGEPVRLLTIDPATGEVTIVGPLQTAALGGPVVAKVSDLAFDGESLYGAQPYGGLYPIDIATGTVGEQVTPEVIRSVAIRDGVAFSMTGGGAYVEFDLEAGAVVATTTLEDPTEQSPASLTFDGDQLLAGTKAFGTLREVDAEDGTYEALGFAGPLDALAAIPADDAARAARRMSPGGADLAAYAARYAELAPTVPPVARVAAPLRASTFRRDHGLASSAATIELAAVTPTGATIAWADGTLSLDADQVRGYRLRANRRGALKLLAPDGGTVARDLIAVTAR